MNWEFQYRGAYFHTIFLLYLLKLNTVLTKCFFSSAAKAPKNQVMSDKCRI